MIRKAILILLALAALAVLAAYPFRDLLAPVYYREWFETNHTLAQLASHTISAALWATGQPTKHFLDELEDIHAAGRLPLGPDAKTVLDGWGRPIWLTKHPIDKHGTCWVSRGPNGRDDGGGADDLVVGIVYKMPGREVVEWPALPESRLTSPLGPYVPLLAALLLAAGPAAAFVRAPRRCRHRLRIVLLCVLTPLAILSAGVWPLSYRTAMHWKAEFGVPPEPIDWSAGPPPEPTVIQLLLDAGVLTVYCSLPSYAAPNRLPGYHPSNQIADFGIEVSEDILLNVGGARLSVRRTTGSPSLGFNPGACLHLPIWMIFATSSVYPAFVLAWGPRRLARRRRKLGLCEECGYDLTRNESGVCPECGTEVNRA